MRDACIRAASAAMGRDLTRAEERNIETRFRAAMLQGARENPAAWRALSEEQRLIEAGKRVADGLVAEANKTLQRMEQTVVAHDRITNYRASQVAEGSDANGLEALERTLIHKYDEKNGGFQSVETRANATFDFAVSQIADIFETVNPGAWQRIQQGMLTIEPLRKAFVDALHGVRDGVPPEIIKAAERYHETANALREQFNAAGGIIGRLEDWGAPHHWSARLAAKAGEETFVNDMIAAADRKRYVHEDGRYYNEAELREFFSEAWKTIVSEGMTKESRTPGFPGGAVKANRGSHHRVIHLKPDAAYEMLRAYSDENVLEAMMGGLRRMARDVAIVETYGPNADHQFKVQLEQAETEAARIDPVQAPLLKLRSWYLQNLFDQLAGNRPPPRRRGVADAYQTVRNINIASKLGRAVITSMSDYSTLYQTALFNRLNPLKVAMNSTLIWAPKSRRFARRMGLVLDTVLGDMERYSGENLTSRDISSRVASTVVRASFLPFVTRARQLGFAMTMMDTIGHLTRQRAYADVTKLKAADYRILSAKGITQATWDIWRAAKVDNWGANHTLLTPDAIMAVDGVPFEAKRQAVIDLLGVVREEQDLAVIVPGARERTQMTQAFIRGTHMGEIGVSAMQFKQFPWTFLLRHAERASIYGAYGRVGYAMSLVLFMTLLGAGANWVKDILSGKDPRPMNALTQDPKLRSIALRNWGQAAMSGGALGLYGEYLFAETAPFSGNTLAESILGPTVSTAGQAASLTAGNLAQALSGEETNFGSEAVNFARGMTPGANLWYTQPFTDRVLFNQLAEMSDPGSLDRRVARQYSRQRTQYWWDPGELTPDRAPDLEAGVRE